MSRHAIAAGILVAGALLARSARAADAAADAAKNYRIETGESTRSARVGEKGRLVLAIQPAPKWHVHPQAPLKIRLEPTAGIGVERTELGHKDAVDPKAEAPRFEVPFTAMATGPQETRASLEFFICSDTACVKQTRAVTVSVLVK